jgi:hypothetical protein
VAEPTVFFAYPASAAVAGQVVEQAIQRLRQRSFSSELVSWRELDIAGRFIAEGVLERIDAASLLVADITRLNFNVTYEIGYAIGAGKRVLVAKHSGFPQVNDDIRSLGIYDTLSYKEYQNADELVQLVRSTTDLEPIHVFEERNRTAPVYMNFAKIKSDQDSLIRYRLKKARLQFRSFDPNETPRLSGPEAIRQVAQSYGVLLHLVPSEQDDAINHNLRASFIAGLADGLGRELLLIQYSDSPVPADYRDAVTYCRLPENFEDQIADFAGRVVDALQTPTAIKRDGQEPFLHQVNFGASTAENELTVLGEYYLEIDAYRRAFRREVRLITGRKGSGKTAIFFQLRDKVRERRSNVVLDLKPDGYQLLKFKDQVLALMASGTLEHTITAFWEYLLLLEICYKLLDKDKDVHKRDHRLFEPYQRLLATYKTDAYISEGDFSERLNRLLHQITEEFGARYPGASALSLSQPEITQLLHKHDVTQLRAQVSTYLQYKEEVWLLFDNIDKGWATHGLQPQDLIVVRTLIEATRKIEREFSRLEIVTHTVIFLRNDVYELLVDATPDRGKETRANVDWGEPNLLREVIRKRIVFGTPELEDRLFDEIWRLICVPLITGEESSQYLIERTLMRPRNFIELLNHCRGYAVSLRHDVIREEDVANGLKAYSADLLRDISLEIRDVRPSAVDAPYGFIGAPAQFNEEQLHAMFREGHVNGAEFNAVYDILLWFGFLGVVGSDGEPKYIYSFGYDFKLFSATINSLRKDGITYQVNVAFWPALGIKAR